jgi:hypothetical protein
MKPFTVKKGFWERSGTEPLESGEGSARPVAEGDCQTVSPYPEIPPQPIIYRGLFKCTNTTPYSLPSVELEDSSRVSGSLNETNLLNFRRNSTLILWTLGSSSSSECVSKEFALARLTN